MAFYKVNFTLNGERCFTTGVSFYPSDEDLIKGNYSKEIALSQAMLFISGYKEAKQIDSPVNRDTVKYTIHLKED